MAMDAWDEASPQKEGIQAEWQRVVDAVSKELLREDEPVGYIGRHVADTLIAGKPCTTTMTKHVAFNDDCPVFLRPAPKVPAGWSLTEEMIQAACSESLSWDVHLNHADIRDLVKVLLTAAPKGEQT